MVVHPEVADLVVVGPVLLRPRRARSARRSTIRANLDAELPQDDERRHRDEHRHRPGVGRRDRRDDRDGQDHVAAAARELPGGDDAEPRDGEDALPGSGTAGR